MTNNLASVGVFLRQITQASNQDAAHPAESQEEVHPTRSLHTVPQFPVHQMLPGEHEEAEAHGYQQHVEDACHVVNVQFTAHHLGVRGKDGEIN